MSAKTAVLLVQLGTPDAPDAPSLRRYLKQFLGDPRVIESAFVRKVIIPLFVLPRRPAQSAAKYRRIWDAQTGSPLLHHTRRQTELLQARFPQLAVRFGMQIGNPSVGQVLNEMIGVGVERLVVLPMYPQYSATTWASATDAVFKALQSERRVPAIRIVPPYYDHPLYIEALADLVRESMSEKPDHCVISFHGIPKSYAKAGDPYATHVVRTTKALVANVGWKRDQWTQTYQSLFGKSVWLKPYTDDVLRSLAQAGKKRVLVTTPGFTADCLETIDEIGHESAELFREAGGELLIRVPCVNEHPKWIDAMESLVRDNAKGWFVEVNGLPDTHPD